MGNKAAAARQMAVGQKNNRASREREAEKPSLEGLCSVVVHYCCIVSRRVCLFDLGFLLSLWGCWLKMLPAIPIIRASWTSLAHLEVGPNCREMIVDLHLQQSAELLKSEIRAKYFRASCVLCRQKKKNEGEEIWLACVDRWPAMSCPVYQANSYTANGVSHPTWRPSPARKHYPAPCTNTRVKAAKSRPPQSSPR